MVLFASSFTRCLFCTMSVHSPSTSCRFSAHKYLAKLMSVVLSLALACSARAYEQRFIYLFILCSQLAQTHSGFNCWFSFNAIQVLDCDSYLTLLCFFVMRHNNYLHTVLASTGNTTEEKWFSWVRRFYSWMEIEFGTNVWPKMNERNRNFFLRVNRVTQIAESFLPALGLVEVQQNRRSEQKQNMLLCQAF